MRGGSLICPNAGLTSQMTLLPQKTWSMEVELTMDRSSDCVEGEGREGSYLLSQSPFLLSRYSVRILSVFCPYSVFLTEYGILSTRREYTEYVKNTRYSVPQNTWSVFCPYSAYSVIR